MTKMKRGRRASRAAGLIACGIALLSLGAAAQEKGEGTVFDFAKGYKSWKSLHEAPVYSKSHGKRLVRTYVNKVGEAFMRKEPALFPPGTIIVKDSWVNENGKAGKQAYLFIMKKEASGSHPLAGDWFWAIATPDFRVLKWQGKIFQGYGGHVQYCIKCHRLVEWNDFYFGSPERLEEEKKKQK